MEIKIRKKTAPGIEVFYPVCKKAGLLCDLAETQTFTRKMIKKALQLGYDIQVVESFELDEWLDE